MYLAINVQDALLLCSDMLSHAYEATLPLFLSLSGGLQQPLDHEIHPDRL